MYMTPYFLPQQQRQGSRGGGTHPRPDLSTYALTASTFNLPQLPHAQPSPIHPSSGFIRPPISEPPLESPSPTSLTSAQSRLPSSHVQQTSPLRPQVEVRPKPGYADRRGFFYHPCNREQDHAQSEGEDSVSVTPDFVRKLYQLLEDDTFSDVLCWGPQGDFFTIKDVNTFTTNILPYTFRHSNFASFVRQLNKYDFHKIRTRNDNQSGDNGWSFRHADFHAGGLDALESIKRKVPGVRKSGQSTSPQTPPAVPDTVENLQARLELMEQQQGMMTAQIHSMQCEYMGMSDAIGGLQRALAQQDGIIQQLAQYFIQHESGGAVS